MPDEIVDPYHYVEFDPGELQAACREHFAHVELYGLFGSPRYLELVGDEGRRLDALLRKDPLRARRIVPRRMRQRLYDWKLSRERSGADPRAAAIEPSDFELRPEPLDGALDLVAVCRSSRC
jgi:hypothetical protein